MGSKRKTGFDEYLEQRMKDRAFAREYKRATREIRAIDELIRSLDETRVDLGMTKSALARKIGAAPALVRRLLTAKRSNPTLATAAKLGEALGLRLAWVPDDRADRRASRDQDHAPGSGPVGATTDRGMRLRNSSPRRRTSA
jgi:ribosome-binding protein aMBF1 (putative translation factor)